MFLIPEKQGKISTYTFSEVILSFWQPLIKQQGSRYFHFLFPDAMPLFHSSLHFSPILSSLILSPKYLLLILQFFVVLSWCLCLAKGEAARQVTEALHSQCPTASTGQQGQFQLPWLHLWVQIKSSKWQEGGKYTCRGSFNLQTLPSSLAAGATKKLIQVMSLTKTSSTRHFSQNTQK